MAASPAQRAAREAHKVAALAMRRQGMTAPAVAEVLGCSARKVRELCEGVDLDAPAAPASAKLKARRRKAPRSFKRRNQPTGRVLRPILLYDGPGGGFGLPRETVTAAGLGENVPIGESASYARPGQVKTGERIVDLGTTVQADERRYASARNDNAIDLPDDFPEGATRMIVEREHGTFEVDLP